MLLLVAAGRGTTGTCNVFRHLCALNLTVVHYRRMCNARKPIEKLRISRIRDRLVNLLLHPHLINTSVLEPLLGEFVDSGVQAVVDSPFPYFMSTLMALVPHAQVLLTTRSPLEWAISRFKHHPGNSFICRCELHSMLEDTHTWALRRQHGLGALGSHAPGLQRSLGWVRSFRTVRCGKSHLFEIFVLFSLSANLPVGYIPGRLGNG